MLYASRIPGCLLCSSRRFYHNNFVVWKKISNAFSVRCSLTLHWTLTRHLSLKLTYTGLRTVDSKLSLKWSTSSRTRQLPNRTIIILVDVYPLWSQEFCEPWTFPLWFDCSRFLASQSNYSITDVGELFLKGVIMPEATPANEVSGRPCRET